MGLHTIIVNIKYKLFIKGYEFNQLTVCFITNTKLSDHFLTNNILVTLTCKSKNIICLMGRIEKNLKERMQMN